MISFIKSLILSSYYLGETSEWEIYDEKLRLLFHKKLSVHIKNDNFFSPLQCEEVTSSHKSEAD